ncbi:hypothetical protein ET524_01340 [Senegalimassilia faecalis]|uniref:Uncharacterized protein n=1 Tax=Senegalimassilia faecalis TaxID=2509433 RepID=A0A4Q2JZA4_9ACTN|nr:hypothetical protein [Senegalimassilia faecalis]RXZ53290.1 hypothetical protein ET524_01340 [Senegalimassilia faecalis]
MFAQKLAGVHAREKTQTQKRGALQTSGTAHSAFANWNTIERKRPESLDPGLVIRGGRYRI